MVASAAAVLLGLGIASVNGANDVSKGIATLVGTGVADARRAILWGTLWTGAGAVSAAFVATAMVQTFGKGLLSSGVDPTLSAGFSAIAGAALWVLLATVRGLPVSTTHAIIGSIIGVAWLAYGAEGVRWSVLGEKVALPLLLSPVVAGLLTAAGTRAWTAWAPQGEQCICAETFQPALIHGGGAASVPLLPEVRFTRCTAPAGGRAFVTLDHLHWITSGATSFARGLNDAPKMVALLLGASALSGGSSPQTLPMFLAVAAGMAFGSAFAGRRVTNVLACDVVRMTHHEGFTANLVTAALVGPGAALGIPMSTTHVSAGAIMGIGATEEFANTRVIRNMLLAWFVTVPFAALLGIAVLIALRAAGLH